MNISAGIIALGVVTGLTYALLAVGLILVYRLGGFINFSHGQLGVFSALLLAKLVIDYGAPYWIAFPISLALAALVGAVVERSVIRRLARASRVTLTVATIAVAQLLYGLAFFQVLRPSPISLARRGFPNPVGWHLSIGSQTLGGAQILVLIMAPCAAGLLAFVLRRTRTGLHVRATAANVEAAQLAGVDTDRVARWIWITAAVLSGLTAILLGPQRGTANIEALGPGLMLRALTAALVGGMTNLWVGVAAGLGLGIFEQVTFATTQRGGLTEVAMFAVMLAVLLWRASGSAGWGRRSQPEVIAASRRSPWPAEIAGTSTAAWIRRAGIGLALGLALGLARLPGIGTASRLYLLTQVVVFAIAGLGLTVIVGWSGQLSLGQWAFVGVGAYTAARLAQNGVSFVLIMLAGALAGAACAVIVGLPALRVRGLFLAVSTLGFSMVAYGWLFGQSLFSSSGSSAVSLPPAWLPGVGQLTVRGIYVASVLTLFVIGIALAGLRRTSAGLRLWAVRDNAGKAAATGISVSGVNLAGFALAGGISAVAGVLWAFATRNFDASGFYPQVSVILLTVVVAGGLESLVGSVLGVVVLLGLPTLFHASIALTYTAGGLVLLVVLVKAPEGFVALLDPIRNRIVRAIFRSIQASSIAPRGADADLPAIVCRDVSVRFGGLAALTQVNLEVAAGEVVGLIGPNGAGKTTLLDCIAGFVPPDEGRILVRGKDLTRLPPSYRAFVGLGRTFQDARTFGSLTAHDNVLVAAEVVGHGGTFGSLLGAPWERWLDRSKEDLAREALALVGLWDQRETPAAQLSLGHRKLLDLATVLVSKPSIILLDEPTAGLPDDEVDRFASVLADVRRSLGFSALVVEHDMRVIRMLVDRLYAMESGEVIADGTPDEVLANPRVAIGYLGIQPPPAEGAGNRAGSRRPVRGRR